MISLTLPYPPSANRYWRNILLSTGPKCPSCGKHASMQARTLMSSEARAYKKRVETMFPPMPIFEGPVSYSARAFRPRRIGDLGNLIKVAEDALQGVAFENDSQITELHWTRHEDKNDPRVEIEIKEMP